MAWPQVAMLSMWRDDAGRDIEKRVDVLLGKSYPLLRWVWVVGDSSDDTEQRLRWLTAQRQMQERVTIVRCDTGILGADQYSRMRRLSRTANAWWPQVRPEDDFCLIHESDIESPPDLVERMLATGKGIIGAWSVLKTAQGWLFYDTFCTHRDGRRFANYPPYHPCFRAGEVIEVDGLGTCWMFPAAAVRSPGADCRDLGALDLCRWMKDHGHRLWLDTTLVVHQPYHLWTPQVSLEVDV